MQLFDAISQLETRLAKSEVPLIRMFNQAGIDRSTWSRWRDGSVSPTLKNWQAVHEAVDSLTSAASNPSSDDTAAHDAAASSDPKSEIPESREPDRDVDGRVSSPSGG